MDSCIDNICLQKWKKNRKALFTRDKEGDGIDIGTRRDRDIKWERGATSEIEDWVGGGKGMGRKQFDLKMYNRYRHIHI